LPLSTSSDCHPTTASDWESDGRQRTALVPYLRQSRARERTISIEEQRRDVRRWTEAAGVELAVEVVEQNVSGSKPWRERALGEAIAVCEAGEAAGIVVAWQDRLSRENGRATADVWEALDAAGARLVCVGDGLDTATGDHEMLFTIKAAIARDQWKRYRANFEGSRRNAIERGVFPGLAPIGYRYRKGSNRPLEVDKREARKVQEAFELRASGTPFSKIARRFGWGNSATRHVLGNEAYLGLSVTANSGARTPTSRSSAGNSSTPSRLPAPSSQSHRATPPGIASWSVWRVARGVGRRCGPSGAKPVTGRTFPHTSAPTVAGSPCPDRAWVRALELDEFVESWFMAALRTVPRMVDVVAAGRDLERPRRNRPGEKLT
jgi:DNA invertase Pin-like site-specific DNA recombinase